MNTFSTLATSFTSTPSGTRPTRTEELQRIVDTPMKRYRQPLDDDQENPRNKATNNLSPSCSIQTPETKIVQEPEQENRAFVDKLRVQTPAVEHPVQLNKIEEAGQVTGLPHIHATLQSPTSTRAPCIEECVLSTKQSLERCGDNLCRLTKEMQINLEKLGKLRRKVGEHKCRLEEVLG